MVCKYNSLGLTVSKLAKEMPITNDSILDILSIISIEVNDDSGLIREDIINSKSSLKTEYIEISFKDYRRKNVKGVITSIDRNGISFSQLIEGNFTPSIYIKASEMTFMSLKDNYKHFHLRKYCKTKNL